MMTSLTGTKKGGFTLLELLLVTSLLAVLLGLVAPSLRGSFHHLQLEQVSRHLASVMRFAQEHAIAQGAFFRLNFDTEEGEYWLTFTDKPPVEGGEDFKTLSTSQGRLRTLPRGIYFDDVRDINGNSLSYITFYPSGRIDEAIIYISNAERTQLALKIQGRLTTVEVEETNSS